MCTSARSLFPFVPSPTDQGPPILSIAVTVSLYYARPVASFLVPMACVPIAGSYNLLCMPVAVSGIRAALANNLNRLLLLIHGLILSYSLVSYSLLLLFPKATSCYSYSLHILTLRLLIAMPISVTLSYVCCLPLLWLYRWLACFPDPL